MACTVYVNVCVCVYTQQESIIREAIRRSLNFRFLFRYDINLSECC